MERINIRVPFEAWYRANRRDFEEYMLAWFEDHYVNTTTEAAWCAWCGAMKFLADRGLITINEEPLECVTCGRLF
jgi:hypothetical protein